MNSFSYSLILCLGHPWLANHYDDLKIPIDMIIPKQVKAYICSSSLRKSALGVCNVVRNHLLLLMFCSCIVISHCGVWTSLLDFVINYLVYLLSN